MDAHDPLNQHHYHPLMLNKGTNNNKSAEIHQDGSSRNDASFKHSTNTSKGRNTKKRDKKKTGGQTHGQLKDNLSGLFDEIINRPEDRLKGSHNHVSAGEEQCQGCEYERIQRESGSSHHISVSNDIQLALQNPMYPAQPTQDKDDMIIQARPGNQYGGQDMINYNMPGMLEYTPERGLQNDMQYYSNLNQMSALYTNPNGLATNISPPQHQYNFANHSQLFPSQTPASKEGSSILNIQPIPTHLGPAFNNPISEWTPVLHPVQHSSVPPRLLAL